MKKCNKVAIIAFFHPEASLCLTKHIAKQGVEVDCYLITYMINEKGSMPGIKYHKASKKPGITLITKEISPEVVVDSDGLPVKYHLLRILSLNHRFNFINKIIFKRSLRTIRDKHYDAINIVGQYPMVEIIHDELKGENIIHTFHEVGSHQDGIRSNHLLDTVIRDRSKVILPSASTMSRFCDIPGSENCKKVMIPIGCLQTLLLYQQDVVIPLNIKPDRPTFLFFGLLLPYKGLDNLAKACKLLEGQSDRFNIIVAGAGKDDSLPYFQTLSNSTVINRFLSDDEMAKLYKQSDVTVLPYKTASQSGIVLTSFMYNNPIIATMVGALPETIKHEYNGLLVDPEKPQALADAMLRIMDDTNLLKSLQHGAASFGHGDEYDWNDIAVKSLAFFKQDK